MVKIVDFPSLYVVAKTEDSRNIAKLKKAGADEVVACHDAGAQMMIDVVKLLE